VTSIFPPDIGGPATHSADLQAELRARGHEISVVTLTDAPRRTEDGHVVRFPRRWPWPVRLVAIAAWLICNRRRYDVVYATGLHPAAVAGGRLAGRPVVVKVVGDSAWDRGVRLSLTNRDFDRFQQATRGSLRLRLMRALRDWSVRNASAVTAPSDYLREVAEGWMGSRATPVRVIPNGVRAIIAERASHRTSTLRLASVGRLVAHKRIDALVQAISMVSGVDLVIVGDGPERRSLEDETERLSLRHRIIFTGSLEHQLVLERLYHSDALAIASSYEGLPHVVLEALALGLPVVTSAVGGASEVVTDGLDGLVIDPPDAPAFAAAFTRLRDDEALRTKLRAGARRTGAHWRFDRCADAVESLLRSLVVRRPRIINLGKTWIDNPPQPDLARKFEVFARHLDATIVSTGPVGVRRVAGVRLVGLPALRPRLLGGVLFYSAAAVFAASFAARRPGTGVVCQSPFEAIGVLALRELVPARRRPRVVIEVHGDWRTASRLYGSPWRRPLAPVADWLAKSCIRRADRVRVVGRAMERLVRDAGYCGLVDRHVAYSDFQAFTGPASAPAPTEPRAVFGGALERPKALDVLIDAWRVVHDALPRARLSIVGNGTAEAELRAQTIELGLDAFIDFEGNLSRERVVQLLDASTCLVLPSRSEGMGRVALEAMARARPVVGSTAGGIPDVVDDGQTGLLVPPDRPAALARALVEILANPSRAARMGVEARQRTVARDPAGEFEAGVARLAAWVARA